MSRQVFCLPWAAAVLFLLLVGAAEAAETPREVHGENSVFASRGIAMAWGVLRGRTEDEAQVIVRIISTGLGYAYLRIEGVDPFTEERKEMLPGQPFDAAVDVRTPRVSFAQFTRRDIQFYTAAAWQAKRPTLTVYYLGVPDTAPEFTSEAALSKYLDDALAKVRSRAQGKTP